MVICYFWKRGKYRCIVTGDMGARRRDVRPTVWRLTDWRLLNAAVSHAVFASRDLPTPPADDHSPRPHHGTTNVHYTLVPHAQDTDGRPLLRSADGRLRWRVCPRRSAPFVPPQIPLVEIFISKSFPEKQ